jgi:hypothetical protein
MGGPQAALARLQRNRPVRHPTGSGDLDEGSADLVPFLPVEPQIQRHSLRAI